MILELFENLNQALDSTPLIALSASFIWGCLSVILSPCHLASIPLIVGFIDEQENVTPRRAFVLSSLFSIGILVTIILIGFITALMGRMLGDIGAWGKYFVALVFLLVGLHLFDLLPFSFLKGVDQSGIKKKGFLAAFVLGLVFGIALGPCTFAYMAPMLAITFSISSESFMYGVALLALYGVGHCAVIVLAGTFTGAVSGYLKWNEKSKGAVILKKVCGVLVVIAGIYMLF